MEPMRVVWAGVVVVVQAPAPQPGRWAGPPAADHDIVLHQVSAWLSGLRQGAQAAPPLPALHFFAPPQPARPEPRPVRPEPSPEQQPEPPFPGLYL
jgi:hypothetical protein